MKSVQAKRLTRSQKDNLFGWFFVIPLIVGVLLILIPVVYRSILFSFSDVKMEDVRYAVSPAGWENYRFALLVDPDFVRSVLTSLGSLAGLVPSVVIFSLFIAVLLNQNTPGRTLFRMILFIPVILSVGYFDTAMSADVMTHSLSNMGAADVGSGTYEGLFTVERISGYLMTLNVSQHISGFLVSLLNGITTVINQSGVQILIFLAGLQSISPSIYESARIEGATGWESFWKITVPVISPMILLNILYTIINAFTSSSNAIMRSIEDVTFGSFKYGLGSAMSWLYFLVIIAVIVVVYLVARKLVFYQERG